MKSYNLVETVIFLLFHILFSFKVCMLKTILFMFLLKYKYEYMTITMTDRKQLKEFQGFGKNVFICSLNRTPYQSNVRVEVLVLFLNYFLINIVKETYFLGH